MAQKARKTIPKVLDQMQSRVLVWIFGPSLFLLCLNTLTGSSAVNASIAFGISLLFALLAWKLRAASQGAAFCGGMICLLLVRVGEGTILHSGLLPLITLFLLTFAATKIGETHAGSALTAEEHRGRNAAQVLANLGVAGILASRLTGSLLRLHSSDVEIVVLAALAEATADTVSSEIGQAFGGQPISLATLRQVEPGTDGAISVLGTFAGIAGAAGLALIGTLACGIPFRGAVVILSCGVTGLFFDSVLGATVESRGWLGNDLVNFTSTLFAAALALLSLHL